MVVDDLNDVQKYQELDNGESPDVGVTALENVTGGNTIVAEATSTITAYEDKELYAFRTAQLNTTAVTLNVDGVGAKSVVKNHDQPIQSGNFEADQNIIVSYNLTDDVFEWVNQNLKSVASYKGTDIADSAAPTVPTDGDYFEALGTTTKTSFAIAANRDVTVKSVSGFTLTSGASIVTETGDDVDIDAGGVFRLQSTAANVVQITKVSSSSGWTFVSSATASASADVSFTGFEAGFDYLITGAGVQNATDLRQLVAELGIAGPTYRTSGYIGMAGGVAASAASLSSGEYSASILLQSNLEQGNAADETASFEMTILDPAAATDTYFQGIGFHRQQTSASRVDLFGGFHSTAEAMDAIRFFYNTGNIAIGEFKLYKRVNA